MAKKSVTVMLPKSPTPQAVLVVGPKTTVGELQGAVGALFKNKKVLPSVGLKFCEGCRSGLDIFITSQYQPQMEVPIQ